jgi:hypothetical protein
MFQSQKSSIHLAWNILISLKNQIKNKKIYGIQLCICLLYVFTHVLQEDRQICAEIILNLQDDGKNGNNLAQSFSSEVLWCVCKFAVVISNSNS